MKTDFKPFQKRDIRSEDVSLGAKLPQRAIKSLLRASLKEVKPQVLPRVRLPGVRQEVFCPADRIQAVQSCHWRCRQQNGKPQFYTRSMGRIISLNTFLKEVKP